MVDYLKERKGIITKISNVISGSTSILFVLRYLHFQENKTESSFASITGILLRLCRLV